MIHNLEDGTKGIERETYSSDYLLIHGILAASSDSQVPIVIDNGTYWCRVGNNIKPADLS